MHLAFEAVEKEGGGAMMTFMLYPVVAAQLQDRSMFDRFRKVSYRKWIRYGNKFSVERVDKSEFSRYTLNALDASGQIHFPLGP